MTISNHLNNTRNASPNKPLMMSKYLESRQPWGRHSLTPERREVFCYQGEREREGAAAKGSVR